MSDLSSIKMKRRRIDPGALVLPKPSSTAREKFIDRVVVGGFPMALQRSVGALQNRGFDDYIVQTIERDLLELSQVRQRAKKRLITTPNFLK